MKKTLTLLCSNRPVALQKMLRTHRDTANHDILVCLDQGDKLGETICERFKAKFLTFENQTVTRMLNSAFLRNYHLYDYFHLSNDDVEYQTLFWDTELIKPIEREKYGISYGHDSYDRGELPTFPMFNKNILAKMGWIQFPKLEKYCGDVIWYAVGRKYKCLHYCPHAKLVHNQDYKSQADFCNPKNPVYVRDQKMCLSLKRAL